MVGSVIFRASIACFILLAIVGNVRSQVASCNATVSTDTLYASPWTVCYNGTTGINGCDPTMYCLGNSSVCPPPLDENSVAIWPDGIRDVAGGCGPLITGTESQVLLGTSYFRPIISGFVYNGTDRYLLVNSARSAAGSARIAIVNPDTFVIEASANINGLIVSAINTIIVGDYAYLPGVGGRVLSVLVRNPVLVSGNFVVPPSSVVVSGPGSFVDVTRHPNYDDILIFAESFIIGSGVQIVSISNVTHPVLMSESAESFGAIGIDCKNFGETGGLPEEDRYVICAVIQNTAATNLGYIYRIDGMYNITRISTFNVVTTGAHRNVIMHPTKPVAYITKLGTSGSGSSRNMLFTIDLTDPYDPIFTNFMRLATPGSYNSVSQNHGMNIGGLDNQYLYLVSGGSFAATDGFVFTGVCIRDPLTPVRVSQYTWEGSIDTAFDAQSAFTDPSNSTMFRMYVGSGDDDASVGRIDAQFCGNGLYGSEECGSTGGPCCDLVTCDYIMANETAICSEYCGNEMGTCVGNQTCQNDMSDACPIEPNGFLSNTTVCRLSNDTCEAPAICLGNNATCPFNPPMNNGSVCRNATEVCMLPAICTGEDGEPCPDNPFASNETLCRLPTGPCGTSTFCNGSSYFCPDEEFGPPTKVCRNSSFICEAPALCTNTSSVCPVNPPAENGTVCRNSTQVCMANTVCNPSNTTSCPVSPFRNSSFECRAPVDDCDLPTFCNETSYSCPALQFGPTTKVCRNASLICEGPALCTNTSGTCPVNPPANNGTICRSANNTCEEPARCSGDNSTCPANPPISNLTVCRNATEVCMLPSFCLGDGSPCPDNPFASNGTLCRLPTGPCGTSTFCNGSSYICPDEEFGPPTKVCRNSSFICEAPALCTNTSSVCPENPPAENGTVCRNSTQVCMANTMCNPANTTSCPVSPFRNSSFECRAPVDDCDLPTFCNETSYSCPALQFGPLTKVCRNSSFICQAPALCTNTSGVCPVSPPAENGTVCRNSTAVCMDNAVCDPTNTTSCPVNPFSSNDTECRPAGGICAFATNCNETSYVCPEVQFVANGTECRAAMPPCMDAASCNGQNDTCPPSDMLPPGTVCNISLGICQNNGTCLTNGTCTQRTFISNGTICDPTPFVCENPGICDGVDPGCSNKTVSPAGTPCSNSTDPVGPCIDGGVCDGFNITACSGVTRKPNGTICEGDVPIPDDQCFTVSECASGLCVPGGLKPVGSPCDTNGEGCVVGVCAADGVCNLISLGTCVTPILPIFPDVPPASEQATSTTAIIIFSSVVGGIFGLIAFISLIVWYAWALSQSECDYIDDEDERRECREQDARNLLYRETAG